MCYTQIIKDKKEYGMGLLTKFAEIHNYSSSYNDEILQSSSGSGSDPSAFAALIISMLIFFVIFYVVFAFLLSKIFKKAGVESWKAWVPVYNSWVMLEIGGQKGYWAIVSFIPLVGIVSLVFQIIAAINIAKNLGKEAWFVLLYFFLPLVWLVWLAFDKSTWSPAGASPMDQPVYQPPVAVQNAQPAADASPLSQPSYQEPIAVQNTQPTTPTNPTPPANPFIQ